MISRQFVRRRYDKEVHATDIRIAQVANLVELPLADKDSRQMALPRSQVLRREVYTKELKGETMVRKFLLWKTNKELATDDFPAYVLHYTDFSPNRKDPLARDIRVSSSFEQIQQLLNNLKADNITKGWNLFTPADPPPPTSGEPIVVPVPVATAADPVAVGVAADAVPVAAAPPDEAAPKKRAARKFAKSESDAPEKKAPRKKKSG